MEQLRPCYQKWLDENTSWSKLFIAEKRSNRICFRLTCMNHYHTTCMMYHNVIKIGPIRDWKIFLKTRWTSPELCSLLTRSTNKGNICVTYLLNVSFSIPFKIRKADTSNEVLAANSSFLAEPSGRIQWMITGFLTGLSITDSELAQFRYICKTFSQTETISCSVSISLDTRGLFRSKSCKKLR